MNEPHLLGQLRVALEADDTATARNVLRDHPSLLAKVRSAAMVDVLIAHELDLGVVSQAWAPGFNLQSVAEPVARRPVERGVTLSVHAVATLGLVDQLRGLLASL